MAKNTKPTIGDDFPDLGQSDADLDNAIGNLRGVLKADADDSLLGGNDLAFGADADDGFPSFGGDFGAETGGGFEMDSTPSFGAADGIQSFADKEPGSALSSNYELIMDIPIDVQIVLGSSRMQVSGLMNLEEGAIIALDKKIGEPVEIMVNGRIIGRGEITVLENDDTRFGVKLTDVLSTKKG
jgi:flagellar motor switch protein FliN/FliY